MNCGFCEFQEKRLLCLEEDVLLVFTQSWNQQEDPLYPRGWSQLTLILVLNPNVCCSSVHFFVCFHSSVSSIPFQMIQSRFLRNPMKSSFFLRFQHFPTLLLQNSRTRTPHGSVPPWSRVNGTALPRTATRRRWCGRGWGGDALSWLRAKWG